MNLVMTEDGNFVEVQATAERNPFPRTRLFEMMGYAEEGIRQLHDLQREAIAAVAKG
jgi:ribonuclease PH